MGGDFMNNKVISLLKDKNYVLPQYLLKNYKNIGLNSEELIFLIYLINLEKPIVCDYNIFSEDVNMKVPEILTLINNLKEKNIIEIEKWCKEQFEGKPEYSRRTPKTNIRGISAAKEGEEETEEQRELRLGQALNKDRAMGRAFSELETALKTKPIFEVVPYDNGRRGLLVAKIQIKDKTAQIPLLFTTPRFGIYTGDFTIGSYAKFTREGELTTVDVSNFNTSTLNKGGLFSSYGKLVSLVVRKLDWQDHIK